MRFTLLVLFFTCLFFTQDLTGQERKGAFWVDGALGVTITDDFSQVSIRGGYFFTERLLVGTRLTSEVYYFDDFDAATEISPFVRYYIGTGQWRPYAEASASLSIYNGGSDVSALLALGVEKEVAPGVLANVELAYGIQDRISTDLRLGLNFNALLGDVDSRLVASSQLRKGSWNYGAQPISIGFVQASSFDLKGYDLNLAPEFAYFLSDRLMLDLRASLAYQNTQVDYETASDVDFKQTDLGLKAGLRGYFSTEKKINLFVQAGMEFDRLSINRKQISNVGVVSTIEFTENQFNSILTLGSTIFVNQSTSLDFGIRTTFDLSDNDTGENRIQPALFAAFRFWSKK